ncbi:craniofacial development protein 2-like [Elysia marginata]|uniref:Craniofacial development protein 2-like n=1 Tax=Elysia marginata TaxID=1093978 RepID=A0AAV4JEC9_9GAST|nr:craniofacial development protein 2-like [Elysia marginata]
MEIRLTKTHNDVKEGSCSSSRPGSFGRERHVPQVTPDRHQATAANLKLRQEIRTATWNVRTLLQTGKLDNIKGEMDRLKINILGLSEVRWKGAGKIASSKHEFIYSGGLESERGVGIVLDQNLRKTVKGYWALSDRVLLVKIAGKPLDLNIIQVYAPTTCSSEEDIENFYEELETAKKQSLTEAATQVIPSLEWKAKQKWMTNEMLEMMNERRKAKGKSEKYKLQHKKVQEECNRAKENWINNKCKDIDLHQKLDPKTM